MSERGDFPPFREMVYDRRADVLHLWLRRDKPTYNEHVRDGLYRIHDLETDELVGFQFVGLSHMATKFPEVREAYVAILALSGDQIVVHNPEPSHALRELVAVG